MRWRVVLGAVGIVGCGSPASPPLSGPPPVRIALAGPIHAVPALPRTVELDGGPGQALVVTLDRPAGTIETNVTLDSNGVGRATYTPCSYLEPDCLGPLTVSVAAAEDPATTLDEVSVSLEKSDSVGDVTPCAGATGNVFHASGTDWVLNGTYDVPTDTPWSVTPSIDTVSIATGSVHAVFSSIGLRAPLAPGVYDDAERAPFVTDGHPGLEVTVMPGNGCNTIGGRFQVHDYDTDASGAIASMTVTFEQTCDGSPQITQGCVHYQADLPAPATWDPAKVSIIAYTSAHEPDPTAVAIFADVDGVVLLDTPVGVNGLAELSLPAGGTVTVLQTDANHTTIHQYRAVSNGDHFEINSPPLQSGAYDEMLAEVEPPQGATVSFVTTCGTGEWNPNLVVPGGVLRCYAGARQPTLDVLGIAQYSDHRDFFWTTGIPHVADGNADFTSQTWTAFSTQSVMLTHVPSTPNLHVTSSLVVGTTHMPMGESAVTSPSADQQFSFDYPVGGGDAAAVEVQLGNPLAATSTDVYELRSTGSPAQVTLDLDALPVRVPSAVTQTSAGFSWSQTTGTAQRRTLFWRAILPGDVRVQWQVSEPADDGTSFTVPSLPDAYAAYDATVTGTSELWGSIVLLSSKTQDGTIEHTRGANDSKANFGF